MTRTRIEVEKKELKSIFSDFWFIIPEYQRAYSWEEDQINDLLEDFLSSCQNRKDDEYFLGSLVLKRTDERAFLEFEVLDGQQRLTTLLLITAVLRDLATDETLKKTLAKRIFQESNEFDGIPERTRIIYKTRDEVEEFIKEFVVAENGTEKVSDIKSRVEDFDKSISHLASAILVIRDFITRNKGELENLAKFISLRPIFIYVSAESREDAFRLFTIINNRGLPLEDHDIFKSINIGEVEQRERDKYARKWEEIENDLGEDFSPFLSNFRAVLSLKRQDKNLIDDFEENIYKKKLLLKGKNTIDSMAKYKEIYDKIIKLNDKFDISNKYRNLITIMNIGLSSIEWIPGIISFYEKFNTNKLFEFLEKLEYKFFADSLLLQTQVQRQDSVLKIMKLISQTNNPNSVLEDRNIFYVDKERLKRVLNTDVYRRKWARYVLLKYEYLNNDDTVQLSNYKFISIEHILPQNPDRNSEWLKIFSEQERKQLTHKFGNLVLISKSKNTKLGNLDFKEKKKVYLNGRIDIFKGSKIFLDTINEWNAQKIKERQEMILNKIIQNK